MEDSTERVEALLDEMLTDAYGDDEQLWAIRQGFADGLEFPRPARVAGALVEVLEFEYDGNERRGLFARCERDGETHEVGAADIVFETGSSGALHVDAYRRWLGVDPIARESSRFPASSDDIDPESPVELAVVRPRSNAVRCILVGSKRTITLRCAGAYGMVPGEVVTVQPGKQWSFKGHPYLSGEVLSHRIDAMALGLTPLELRGESEWDSDEQYWGEGGEIPEWAAEIVERGPRPAFRMEKVVPGDDESWSDGPILEAIALYRGGHKTEAREMLYGLLERDLRCLDAHAHLGSWEIDLSPQRAIRHYEVGVRIGELSLDDTFERVLPWGRIDNRPFHRCLQGYGLALWRLERWDEAEAVFERMLWLNPSDNLGARFVLPDIRRRVAWTDRTN